MRVETGTPILIDTGFENAAQLTRVSTSDTSIIEDWIQQLIFEHPTVLPIFELDPAFAPAIPIGREVPTTAGPIDALFISPSGDLTIVEAKLWRNPQARREVVGQIIDYATALAEWTYDDLDNVCRARAGSGLWELVTASDASPFETEQSFVDTVARNFAHGRFLLLVVGDGIRQEVERMVEYVQVAPQLRFSLALVELRIFDIPGDERRLVVPSVVMRTDEVTRAVVQVKVDQDQRVNVNVTVPSEDNTEGRRRLTEDQFFEELGRASSPDVVDFARSVVDEFRAMPGFRIHLASASIVLKYDSPTDGTSLTILVFTKTNTVYPGWLQQQLTKSGLDPELGFLFVEEVATIVGASVHSELPDSWTNAISIDELEPHYSRVRDAILRFVTSLQPSGHSEAT